MSLQKAIDKLADTVPYGHLLAATGGAGLLGAAADHITKLETRAAELEAERDALTEQGIADARRMDTFRAENERLEKRIAELEAVLAEAHPYVAYAFAVGVAGAEDVAMRIDALLKGREK